MAQPDPHAAPKGDVARAGANCLALQEEQDEASIRPVGQPNASLNAINAGLQDQCQIVALTSPRRCLLRLVREGGEGETAIGEAHPLGIVAENLVSCFDDLALVLRQCLPPRFFDAMLQYQLMHIRHDRERDAPFSTASILEFGGRSYSKSIRFFSY